MFLMGMAYAKIIREGSFMNPPLLFLMVLWGFVFCKEKMYGVH